MIVNDVNVLQHLWQVVISSGQVDEHWLLLRFLISTCVTGGQGMHHFVPYKLAYSGGSFAMECLNGFMSMQASYLQALVASRSPSELPSGLETNLPSSLRRSRLLDMFRDFPEEEIHTTTSINKLYTLK